MESYLKYTVILAAAVFFFYRLRLGIQRNSKGLCGRCGKNIDLSNSQDVNISEGRYTDLGIKLKMCPECSKKTRTATNLSFKQALIYGASGKWFNILSFGNEQNLNPLSGHSVQPRRTFWALFFALMAIPVLSLF